MFKNHLKVVVINILVFLGLIMLIDFLAIAIYEARFLVRRISSRSDMTLERLPSLPAYEGVPWVNDYVRDQKQEQTTYFSFIGWRRLPMRTPTVNIDSNGVRLSIRYPGTPSNALKVAFLGGSTMWGSGAPDSLTIPSLFNRLGKGRYDAVNFGESSYNAYQGYQFLLQRTIEGYRPDIVVSYDGANNSTTNCPRPFAHAREKQITRLIKGADRQVLEEFTFKGHYLKPIGTLLRRTAEAAGIVKADTYFGKTTGNSEGPMTDEEAAGYLLDSWMATLDLAERIGARFLCILQPNVRVGQPNLSHMKEEDLGHFSFTYYEDLLRLIETDRYSRLKPHFMDLRNAFDGVPKLYVDFCHVSPKGNDIVARRIIERVDAMPAARDLKPIVTKD